MGLNPTIPTPWVNSPIDAARIAEWTARNDAAKGAGVTGAMFPSDRPIGSLLDDLSARPEQAKVLGAQRVRNLLAHASHFLLDEDAGARVVDMVENNAQLISDLRAFARLPFERMTVSLPTRAVHDADRETLLLVEMRDGVKTFALALRDTRRGDIVPIPGWYSSAEDRDGKVRTVIRMDGPPMPDDVVHRQQVGTYSLALDAVLLFLNQKKGVHITEPTMRRRSIRAGRNVTYFARSTISLSIDAAHELRRSYATGERGPTRRHGVRGHFFHRGGVIGCTHRWAALDGHPNGHECVDCGRRRFWRKEFERGDANIGLTVARYQVQG